MKTKTKLEAATLTQFKVHAVAGAFALMLLLPSETRGDGVVTECTESNLRAAMAGGGAVSFACDGTITLSNAITIGADTILDGSGHQVTISGGDRVRVFLVATNSAFSLIQLTVANGRSTNGAGLFNDGGMVTLVNATFLNNVVTNATPAFPGNARGGGIYMQAGALDATNCAFAGNAARQGRIDSVEGTDPIPSLGGAVCLAGGVANLVNCAFSNNVARGGAGSYTRKNGAAAAGGAIYNAGVLYASACTFLQSSSSGGPGGDGRSYTMLPTSGGDGGEAQGGAVFNSGSLRVDGSLFASNSATGAVGGLGGSGTIWIGTYSDQSGRPGGGGGEGNSGALFNSGMAALINCTLIGNTGAGGVGGAGGNAGSITWNPHGEPTIGFPGGPGGSGGRGLGLVGGGGPVQMTNCTIAFNSATAGSGALGGHGSLGLPDGANGLDGTAFGGLQRGELINTLLANNGPGGNGSGALADLGHNLSSDGSCTFTNVGSLNNADPMLGPLANNGGPTLTMALLPGSPAIDTGDNAAAPPTDQRGHPRPVGLAADIGAYEYGTTPRLRLGPPLAGIVEILLSDASGPSCRLFKSATLADWQCVATNQVGTNGTALFQDNCGPGETQRFYRVAVP